MVTSNPISENGQGATSWDVSMLSGRKERSKGQQSGTSGMMLAGSVCMPDEGMMTWAVRRRHLMVCLKLSRMRLWHPNFKMWRQLKTCRVLGSIVDPQTQVTGGEVGGGGNVKEQLLLERSEEDVIGPAVPFDAG